MVRLLELLPFVSDAHHSHHTHPSIAWHECMQLAAGYQDHTVRLWDTRVWHMEMELHSHLEEVTGISYLKAEGSVRT